MRAISLRQMAPRTVPWGLPSLRLRSVKGPQFVGQHEWPCVAASHSAWRR